MNCMTFGGDDVDNSTNIDLYNVRLSFYLPNFFFWKEIKLICSSLMRKKTKQDLDLTSFIKKKKKTKDLDLTAFYS